jgi:hypothetical protein
MSIDQGRTGKIWVKKEADYGVEETLASANAFRHIDKGSWDHVPFSRVASPEKNPSPGLFRRFDRKPATSLSGLNSNIQPSGTLNTLAEGDPFFEAAFGAKTNVTLDTTVSASPTPTTTGATVASAGTLAIGDAVLIEVTGQLGPYVRVLTGVASNALTWAPALPAAPTTGDALKGCVTYKFTTALALSLTILHVLGTKRKALIGCGIDSLELAFDANSEVQMTVGGPARDRLATADAQSEPAAFTSIGTQNPPSGIVDGYTMIDDTVYLMKTLNIGLTNALNARNSEYGVRLPSELNRNGSRDVTVSLDAWSETEATLKDLTEAGTLCSVLNQTGKTEGNIIAVYMPKVDFAPPSENDPDGEVNWSFSGVALESTQGGNNELALILA